MGMEKRLRPPPQELTDQQLVKEVRRLARLEERVVAALVAHLVEVDRRELHVAAGYETMFDYCHRGLGLSKDAAWNRMAVARACRKYPLALELLTSGALHLTAVRLLEQVLTEADHREVLEAARHKTKREVELLIAQVAPRPDVRAVVRKLPAPKAAPAPAAELPLEPAAACAAPARPPTKATRSVVEPLAPARFKVQFTVGEAFQARLVRAQELLGRRVAPGDLEAVFHQALELLARSSRSRSTGRRIVRGRTPGRPGPIPATSRPGSSGPSRPRTEASARSSDGTDGGARHARGSSTATSTRMRSAER